MADAIETAKGKGDGGGRTGGGMTGVGEEAGIDKIRTRRAKQMGAWTLGGRRKRKALHDRAQTRTGVYTDRANGGRGRSSSSVQTLLNMMGENPEGSYTESAQPPTCNTAGLTICI